MISGIIISLVVIQSHVEAVFAAKPISGNWAFVLGSNFKAIFLTLTVGSLDTNGNLIGWKLGNTNLIGNYDSSTGKIHFSTQYKLAKLYPLVIYDGYYIPSKSPCTDPDLPGCISYMTGIWNAHGIVKYSESSGGWFAEIYAHGND